jgi:hypothetical protein
MFKLGARVGVGKFGSDGANDDSEGVCVVPRRPCAVIDSTTIYSPKYGVEFDSSRVG